MSGRLFPRVDVGLGTAYERLAVYRLFDRWLGSRRIATAFEGPIDGMAGIPGLHLLGLARRGTKVTVALPDPEALEVVRGVYRWLGVEDRLETLLLAEDAPPPARYELVLTYNALPEVPSWPGYLESLAARASRFLIVSVTNPLSYGVWIRKALRTLEPTRAAELFDHPSTHAAALEPLLARMGRVVEHTYLDAPWWPDLFVPIGQTTLEGLLGRLPVVGRFVPPATPDNRPPAFLYGPERFPLFPGTDGHGELEAAERRHPAFDAKGDALGMAFGHHHAYLIERG